MSPRGHAERVGSTHCLIGMCQGIMAGRSLVAALPNPGLEHTRLGGIEQVTDLGAVIGTSAGLTAAPVCPSAIYKELNV